MAQIDLAVARRFSQALGKKVMSWIDVVPIIFFILLILNKVALALWIRPKLENTGKTFPKTSWKGDITLVGMFVFGSQIFGYLVGLAAPVFAPTSLVSLWISKHGIIVYFAWCTMLTITIAIVFGLLGYPVKSNDNA